MKSTPTNVNVAGLGPQPLRFGTVHLFVCLSVSLLPKCVHKNAILIPWSRLLKRVPSSSGAGRMLLLILLVVKRSSPTRIREQKQRWRHHAVTAMSSGRSRFLCPWTSSRNTDIHALSHAPQTGSRQHGAGFLSRREHQSKVSFLFSYRASAY